jgi:hypothetical protein
VTDCHEQNSVFVPVAHLPVDAPNASCVPQASRHRKRARVPATEVSSAGSAIHCEGKRGRAEKGGSEGSGKAAGQGWAHECARLRRPQRPAARYLPAVLRRAGHPKAQGGAQRTLHLRSSSSPMRAAVRDTKVWSLPRRPKGLGGGGRPWPWTPPSRFVFASPSRLYNGREQRWV